MESRQKRFPVYRTNCVEWGNIGEHDRATPIEPPHQRDFSQTQRTAAVEPDLQFGHRRQRYRDSHPLSACPLDADSKRCMACSRRRNDRRLSSARLFSPRADLVQSVVHVDLFESDITVSTFSPLFAALEVGYLESVEQKAVSNSSIIAAAAFCMAARSKRIRYAGNFLGNCQRVLSQ